MQSKKAAKKKAAPRKNPSNGIDGPVGETKVYIGEKLAEPDGGKEMKMPTPAEHRQSRSDELLREAARQIKHLREINERLSIRTRAYDDFLSVFRNDPPSRNGAGATMVPDLVYSIERHLEHDSF
jgi:hypothetical protein